MAVARNSFVWYELLPKELTPYFDKFRQISRSG
jgi:hypothetical protein